MNRTDAAREAAVAAAPVKYITADFHALSVLLAHPHHIARGRMDDKCDACAHHGLTRLHISPAATNPAQ